MGSSSVFLYKKKLKSGVYWYARIPRDEDLKGYVTRSTGIPAADDGRSYMLAYQKAESIAQEIRHKSIPAPLFLDYIREFWSEGSDYLQHKALVQQKPLSPTYVNLNLSGIKKWVAPYPPFENIKLSKLNAGIISDWQVWAIKNGCGHRRVNAVLQAITVPVRWVVRRGDLPTDPLVSVAKIPESPKEKGILDANELAALLEVQLNDPRAKLAVLLGAYVGLRRGECRGLQWQHIDLEKQLIRVESNYIDGEGIKPCKWGSNRTVILPSALLPTLEEVRRKSLYGGPESFVLFGLNSPCIPASIEFIRKAFYRMMKAIGIDEKERNCRNLTFHGMRHTWVSHAREMGLPDLYVQALAGHSDARMMNHYTHMKTVIDFEEARRRLEGTRKKVAGGET